MPGDDAYLTPAPAGAHLDPELARIESMLDQVCDAVAAIGKRVRSLSAAVATIRDDLALEEAPARPLHVPPGGGPPPKPPTRSGGLREHAVEAARHYGHLGVDRLEVVYEEKDARVHIPGFDARVMSYVLAVELEALAAATSEICSDGLVGWKTIPELAAHVVRHLGGDRPSPHAITNHVYRLRLALPNPFLILTDRRSPGEPRYRFALRQPGGALVVQRGERPCDARVPA